MSEARPCRACGCPLVFIEGPNGKPIPLDTRSVVYRVEEQLDGTERAVVAKGHYVSHFRTCTKPGLFSGGKP